MDQETLVQRLMATFRAELDEHVRALNRDLLALEKASADAKPELLRTLFRTVHSLKGAARSVRLTAIEAACHRAENLLGPAREGKQELGSDAIQVLFAFADALAEARLRLEQNQPLTGAPIEAIAARLEREVGPAASAGMSAVRGGEPTPPPFARFEAGAVRVPSAKLDALLLKSDALRAAGRRAAERLRDIAELEEMMALLRADWGRARRPPLPGAAFPEASGRPAPAGDGRSLPHPAARAMHGARERLELLGRGLERLAARFSRDQQLLERAANALDEEVRRLRMLPFGQACEGLERTARDLARSAGKQVELALEGIDVGLDRAILEGLRAPLMHLVRNAVDHGIEPVAEREAAGKPACGRVVVSATLRGSSVEVAVSDDGRGIALEAVRERARQKGWPVPQDERELAQQVFEPGFTTASQVTEVSGRGMGLDAVRHAVAKLNGSVDLTFEAGRGARFALTLPLTLTSLRALLVRCAGQVFAIPAANVRRLARATAADFRSVEGRAFLLSGADPVPAASLQQVLGMPEETRRAGERIPLVVLGVGERSLALAVDELLAEQDVVVKTLGPRLRRLRPYAGATVLASGRVALILSAPEVLALASGQPPGRVLPEEPLAGAPPKRILVADDSPTTRSLMKLILEAAGFQVRTAGDGEGAWRALQEEGADCVVADVEMPRMDGFQLTEVIRASSRFRRLPVVLVTALESDGDRARGLEAGASAYLRKSTFDQTNLLHVIRDLV